MSHGTPFSFHCMICFEEFTPEDRYPVVLPCGHTYVCNACSERLDKCMECRTPLYMTMAKTPTGNAPSPTTSLVNASRSTWSSRNTNRYENQYNERPQPPVKKRLPLPKNVVLLSLIEATALASEDVRPKHPDSPGNDSTDYCEGGIQAIRTMGSMVDMEQDEEDKIRMGTSLAVGVAGTYAVACKEGLELYPVRPKAMTMDDRSTTLADEDVENVVRFFGSKTPRESPSRATSPSSLNPIKLNYGDRVQVVSIKNNWAKLARGYGYVRAERHHLVKVGNAVDRACKLEAILRNLSERKRELRIEQTEIDNQFIRMLNSLQASLQNDEDLTVIAADAFSPVGADDSKRGVELDDRYEENSYAKAPPEPDEFAREKAVNLERQPTPPVLNVLNGRLSCFATSVFETDGPMSLVPTRVSLPDLASSSTLMDAFNPRSDTPNGILPAASHPSASAMRAGAQAWRDRNSQQARSGINFRTGMSGHMGVLGTNTRHPHDYLAPAPEARQQASKWTGSLLRMSSHTGLTTTTSRTREQPTGLLASLTPSILLPRHDEIRDQLQQAGSV